MAKPNPPRSARPSILPAEEAPGPWAARPQDRECLALTQIITRAHRTRELNAKHVVALAESIAAVGLIHPPAVDRLNRLLAGGHRLAALAWLQEHATKRFVELFPQGVPVWRMDLNADSDVDLALAVEISENEQRRDYRPAEIRQLADRLKEAGFHYAAEGGRPKADHRPLMPALEVIVGKSVRHLRRILHPPVPAQTRTYDLVLDLKRFLDHSERLSAHLGAASELPELAALKAELGRANRMTSRALAALGAPAPLEGAVEPALASSLG
jgi:hypothetical protein